MLSALIGYLCHQNASGGRSPSIRQNGATGDTRTQHAHSGSSAGPVSDVQARDPLYRRTFVGRERELRLLRRRARRRRGRRRGLAIVAGEPDIGKSALCEQMLAYAVEHRAEALVGHCHETGSVSLPDMPFVEALRSYVMDSDAGEVHAAVGTHVARPVPELTERLDIATRPPGDPADHQWRLLQAVTGFL